MPETNFMPILRSGLAESLPALSSASAQAQAGVRVAEWPHVACLVLRGRADDAAFLAAVQAVCGLALPQAPSSFTQASAAVALWVSPDEWCLLVPRTARDELLAALVQATAGLHVQVADNSGGMALLHLAGPQHAMVLRHLCPYDVDRLTVGRAVSTQLPKATWTLIRSHEAGVMLLLRRSFADWVWRLVERSARPYGLAVCTPRQLPCPAFDALLASPSSSGVFPL